MHIVGKTIDGKVTVAGLGKFYFESGLPFSFIFDTLIKNNMMPSWIHLVAELKDNGMSRGRIYHLFHEHIIESYGKDFRDHVIFTLKNINYL